MKRLMRTYLSLLSIETAEEAAQCGCHWHCIPGRLLAVRIRTVITGHSLHYLLESENSSSFLGDCQQQTEEIVVLCDLGHSAYRCFGMNLSLLLSCGGGRSLGQSPSLWSRDPALLGMFPLLCLCLPDIVGDINRQMVDRKSGFNCKWDW